MTHPQEIPEGSSAISRFILDCALWAFCLVLVGFLTRAGVIDNAGIALGGAALWFGLRAHSKRGVA